jgi:hypothetical protein
MVSIAGRGQNAGVPRRLDPPDLHRRYTLLAALPWLSVPMAAPAAEAHLRKAMRRAEELRDEAV